MGKNIWVLKGTRRAIIRFLNNKTFSPSEIDDIIRDFKKAFPGKDAEVVYKPGRITFRVGGVEYVV